MGLDMTHDAWHDAYHSFYEWRCRIWSLAGHPMIPDPERGGRLRPDCFSKAALARDLPNPPADPLEYVVNHSDCDGDLTTHELALLIPRLEELLALMDDDDLWMCERTEAMIAGFRRALEVGERVEFR